MKGTRVFPRATNILRSVMIAGAGTALWMTLSATGANADTGADEKPSLLGGVTSTVSSVAEATVPESSAHSVSVPVPNVALPAPVKAVVPAQSASVPVPAVTPFMEHVGGAVGEIVGTVPLVNQVVPGGTVGTVVEAVAVPVTETVDHTVAAVVPPVNEALKPVALEPVTDVTNPIVQPIVDVVDEVLPPVGSVLPPLLGGAGSLPPAAPAGDVTPGVGTLPTSGVVSSPQGAAAMGTATQEPAAVKTVPATRAIVPGTATVASPVLSISRVLGSASSVQAVGAGSTQEHTEPADLPSGPGAVPAGLAGTGSGNSQNGPPSPAAAFLHGALIIPADSLTDLETVSDEQHPKPVSFDPGSSPD
ncbi:hypothetical protein [Paenarthrobacter sp. 4246]|uniref:hypothetical protein n=1 Tax=Paenarthrobacter sp. 4246 TaxID=3156456 RepID=UPI0033941188